MLNIITQRWNEVTLAITWLILLVVSAHICRDVLWRNRQNYPKEIQLLGLITLLCLVASLFFTLVYLSRPL